MLRLRPPWPDTSPPADHARVRRRRPVRRGVRSTATPVGVPRPTDDRPGIAPPLAKSASPQKAGMGSTRREWTFLGKRWSISSHSSVIRFQMACPATGLASNPAMTKYPFWLRTSVMAKSNDRSAKSISGNSRALGERAPPPAAWPPCGTGPRRRHSHLASSAGPRRPGWPIRRRPESDHPFHRREGSRRIAARLPLARWDQPRRCPRC